ncbi:MAG: GtrA family protein [Candidatus Sulfotelmatobacter sp.]|jgi:hypothetical protein
MTPTAWPRFLKFSLVGALGIAVQFGVLALLTAIQINYLLATGLAVECAVLHNFLWHQRFTWSDRISLGRPQFAAISLPLSPEQRTDLTDGQSAADANPGGQTKPATARCEPHSHSRLLRLEFSSQRPLGIPVSRVLLPTKSIQK